MLTTICHKIYNRILMDILPKVIGRVTLFFYGKIFKGFSYGKNILCWGIVNIHKSLESEITLGDNVRIVTYFPRAGMSIFQRVKFAAFGYSYIRVGNNVAFNGTSISARKGIEIGDGTIFSPNVIVIDSDFHAPWPPENRTFNPAPERDEEVFIGKNCWIGTNAIILKGVKIGDNSIIGAGSVVVKDIPENCIAAGNPAKVVKALSGSSDFM